MNGLPVNLNSTAKHSINGNSVHRPLKMIWKKCSGRYLDDCQTRSTMLFFVTKTESQLKALPEVANLALKGFQEVFGQMFLYKFINPP